MQLKAAPALSSRDADILRSLARRVDPADPGAQNNIGVLYYRRGMFDEAIAAFSRALALDERMRVARRNLEIAYGESGLLERRAADLERRLSESPDDIGLLVESGIAERRRDIWTKPKGNFGGRSDTIRIRPFSTSSSRKFSTTAVSAKRRCAFCAGRST